MAQRRLLLAALAIGALLHAMQAEAGSEKPSALLVFPRIEVDSAQGVDTVVQISNYGMQTIGLLCFYVNALGSCGSSAGPVCRTDADCPPAVPCVQRCGETDFIFTMTPGQTLGFPAGQGLVPPVIDMPPGVIVPTQTDPFFGELKCVEVDPATDAPIARNDLTGIARIVHTTGPDVAAYSAIGIESTGRNNGDATLCLGSNATGSCTAAEYVRCPDTLDFDHLTEGATVNGAQVANELTLVPCSEVLDQPRTLVTQVELVVINEFEERRCGMFSVSCVGDIHLADYPLFSLGVQGTLAAHTRLRPVTGGETDTGHALLGIALERHVGGGGQVHRAASSLTSEGASEQADLIRFALPPAPAPVRPVIAARKPRAVLLRNAAAGRQPRP